MFHSASFHYGVTTTSNIFIYKTLTMCQDEQNIWSSESLNLGLQAFDDKLLVCFSVGKMCGNGFLWWKIRGSIVIKEIC